MDRLTENYIGCYQIKGCDNFTCEEICNNVLNCGFCSISEAINKLADYENLEEQGLLLRLPCKVGTKVYAINRIIDYGEVGDESIYCYSIIEREFQIYMMMDYGKLVFGGNVFLTKAEAEQKLKEMESD